MAALSDEFYSYLITDPQFYSSDSTIFRQKLAQALSNHKVSMACFRDKTSPNFEELAISFLETCADFGVKKTFINQRLDIAHKLKANGVHLTSRQFDEIKNAKSLGLEVFISCHTTQEIEFAQSLGVNFATISPIFRSPNKGEPIGIEILQEAKKILKTTKLIALGGIDTKEKVEIIKSSDADGFASIRYFAN